MSSNRQDSSDSRSNPPDDNALKIYYRKPILDYLRAIFTLDHAVPINGLADDKREEQKRSIIDALVKEFRRDLGVPVKDENEKKDAGPEANKSTDKKSQPPVEDTEDLDKKDNEEKTKARERPPAGRMLPTFITEEMMQKCGEKNEFLTLDLGGTNLRICLVKFDGQREKTTLNFYQQGGKIAIEVPQGIKKGNAKGLFEFLAVYVKEAINGFRDKKLLEHTTDPLYLCLAFSFPVDQERLDAGKLVRWTKEYTVEGVIDNDVVGLLQKALESKLEGLEPERPVKCVALVNDTVSTMLASAYVTEGNSVCGVIFGTGTNSAYLEKNEAETYLGDLKKEPMILNTEWGAFDQKLPITHFDNQLDQESNNPRSQVFEKFVSGKYLGEITRLVLHFLAKGLPNVSIIFKGRETTWLTQPYKLDASILSAVEDAWLERRQESKNENDGDQNSMDKKESVLIKNWDEKWVRELGMPVEDTQRRKKLQNALNGLRILPSYDDEHIRNYANQEDKKNPDLHLLKRLEYVQEAIREKLAPIRDNSSKAQSDDASGKGVDEKDNGTEDEKQGNIEFRDQITLADAFIVREVCHLIARRAVELAGCAIIAILVQTKTAELKPLPKSGNDSQPRTDITIGVDGSLAEHYPTFGDIVKDTIRDFIGEEVANRVKLILVKDGSTIGAAIAARIGSKSPSPNTTKADKSQNDGANQDKR